MNDPAAGATMRALVAASSNPADQALRTVDRPVPVGDDVLVSVRAAAVTPGELEWPEQWPVIPAHDVSGTVVQLGTESSTSADVTVGEQIIALIAFDRPGAAAEFVCVSARDLARKPGSLEHGAAAALPLGALTAWQALFDHAALAPGQHVLVHGGAGGVGSYAVQLAAQHGARVTATASARDLEAVRALGAQDAIDYSTRFEDVIAPVDVVLDTVGGEVTARSWPLLRPGGILVAVAEDIATPAARPDVRAVYFVVRPDGGQLSEIAARAADGRLRPAVGRTVPFDAAASALDPPPGTADQSGRTVIRVRP